MSLQDYEPLELIFCALPRGDVKPLAGNLLAWFGDLSDVLSAIEVLLLEVIGIGL